MGPIHAAVSAAGGVLSDQLKDYWERSNLFQLLRSLRATMYYRRFTDGLYEILNNK